MTEPAGPFVTLTQALSWIAFGGWSHSDHYWQSYNESKQRLEQGLEEFCDAACTGEIVIHAKLVPHHDAAPSTFNTVVVPQERFHDFRQYDQVCSSLRFGSGLFGFGSEDAEGLTYTQQPIVRAEFYRDVVVSKDQLIGKWPNPVAGKTAPYERVLEWCRQWKAKGKGADMNKAWKAFKINPEFKGCSRDHVFRPAWRET